MTTTINLKFFVSCDHKVEKYRLSNLLVTCSVDRQGEGKADRYYVSIPTFGCSKSYAKPEHAINEMLNDHACFDIRILPQVQTVVPVPAGWESVDGGASPAGWAEAEQDLADLKARIGRAVKSGNSPFFTAEAPAWTEAEWNLADDMNLAHDKFVAAKQAYAEARAKGQLDRVNGHDAYYGCHVGMRSTREECIASYHAGWKEIDHALTHGDNHAPVPATLNGHPVVAKEEHANCSTVMVLRDDNSVPYVVATWWPSLGTSWSWGHYCDDRVEADRAFRAAASRNAAR